MKNKIIVAVAIVLGVAPYASQLLAVSKRDQIRSIKQEIANVEQKKASINAKIKNIDAEMDKAEQWCESTEGFKKGSVCQFANETLAAKGMTKEKLEADLENLDEQLADLQAELKAVRSGKQGSPKPNGTGNGKGA